MSIDQIRVLKDLGLAKNKPVLNFTKTNVISIVGKNGTGKTLFLKGLEKELNELRSDSQIENSNIKLCNSINKYDVVQWIEKIDKSNKFNEKTVNDIKKYFDNNNLFNANKKTITNLEFIKKIDQAFFNKVSKFKGALEENIFKVTSDFKKYESIYKECETKTDFWDFIKQIESKFKTNDMFKQFFNNTIKEYKELVKFIKERINSFNVVLYDCINNFDDVDFNFNILCTYIKGVTRPSVQSMNKNLFFYNIIRNSNIKVVDFLQKNIKDVIQLNNDVNFQESVKKWFQSILNQPLDFSIEFKTSNAVESDYKKSIKVKINVYDKQLKEVLDFQSLSTGTKNILKLFNKIPRVDNQSIIILDEPETGMHPLMQYDFYEIIKSLAQRTKARFILSTHSMFFINKENENSIYICDRDTSYDGKQSIGLYNVSEFRKKHHLGFETKQKDKNATFEFIQYIPYFDIVKKMFDKNKINVIVEGYTDVLYLSKIDKLINNDAKYNFIRPGLYLPGYKGGLQTYELLIKFFKKDINKIILTYDDDVNKNNPKWVEKAKEITNGKILSIGKEGKTIESLFEGKDEKYSWEKYKEDKGKLECAESFNDEIKSLDELDQKTIANFKNLFKQIDDLAKQ